MSYLFVLSEPSQSKYKNFHPIYLSLLFGRITSNPSWLHQNNNQTQNTKMDDLPHTTIQLAANRPLFQKGEPYSTFYLLVSGELSITISQNCICLTDSIVFGDYQILQNIDYRLSMAKAVTKCVVKEYNIRLYSKLNLHREIDKTFSKFGFASKNLKYWVKKLFFIQNNKRNDQVGSLGSIGVVVEGNYRIDRNIPIVRMKSKRLQLLKKFEICLMGCGEIFEGSLVCESNTGLIGVCPEEYAQQLSRCFEQFGKIRQIAAFKGEVHNSMELDIARNCRKKARLYENMVPLSLKDHIRTEPAQPRPKQHLEDTPLARQNKNVFQLQNSISQFLHRQWRKGLSLSIHRKEVSPPVKSRKESRGQLSKRKEMKLNRDINGPVLVTFDVLKDWKKYVKTGRPKLQCFAKPYLPCLPSIRIYSEANEKLITNRKRLNIQ